MHAAQNAPDALSVPKSLHMNGHLADFTLRFTISYLHAESRAIQVIVSAGRTRRVLEWKAHFNREVVKACAEV